MILLLCFLGSGLVDYFLHARVCPYRPQMLIGLDRRGVARVLLLILHFRKEVKPFNELLKLGRSLSDDDLTR